MVMRELSTSSLVGESDLFVRPLAMLQRLRNFDNGIKDTRCMISLFGI